MKRKNKFTAGFSAAVIAILISAIQISAAVVSPASDSNAGTAENEVLAGRENIIPASDSDAVTGVPALPVWEAWKIRDRIPVLAVAEETGKEAIRSKLPDTYQVSMIGNGFKSFFIEWNLEESYRAGEDFKIMARFTGYCPEEDAWYELRTEDEIFDPYLTTIIHYVKSGPIRDLTGVSRTFSSTSIVLSFNELDSGLYEANSFMPPDAERIYVEYSIDGASWSVCDFADEPELGAASEASLRVYPGDSVPRHYRIRVVGGCQSGVSNEIILPIPSSGDNAGKGEDGGNHSYGGEDDDIGGNRGGGTAIVTPDRKADTVIGTGPGYGLAPKVSSELEPAAEAATDGENPKTAGDDGNKSEAAVLDENHMEPQPKDEIDFNSAARVYEPTPSAQEESAPDPTARAGDIPDFLQRPETGAAAETGDSVRTVLPAAAKPKLERREDGFKKLAAQAALGALALAGCVLIGITATNPGLLSNRFFGKRKG